MENDESIVDLLEAAAKTRDEELAKFAATVEKFEWRVPFQTTEESYHQSLTPRQALSRYPYDANLAVTQMIRELSVQKVEALCELLIWKDEGGEQRAPHMTVPLWVWKHANLDASSDFWDTGYLDLSMPLSSYSFSQTPWLRSFGVRFWPYGLPDRSDADGATSRNSPHTSKGGRPAKPWWDEMWAHIAADLFNGGLKPFRLADVEKAMHDWVVSQGHTVSETPIRSRARMLMKAIDAEDST